MFFQIFLFLAAGHIASTAVFNGSSIVRTFARRYELVTGEPIDLQEFDSPPEESGSGTGLSNGSRPGLGDGLSNGSRSGLGDGLNNGSRPGQSWTGQHPVMKQRFYISDKAAQFLTSPLSTIFIPTVYTLVFLISVPLNAIAVVTFARRIRPMKPAVIYMLNLACADLLFVLLLPFKIYYHYGGNNWAFGPEMCRVLTAAFYCNMYCSVLLITCISFDRLLAVVYPIDSLAWRRPRNAFLACLTMWVLAVGGSVPLALFEQTVHIPELDITTCHDVLDLADLQERYLVFFPALSCALYFLPLVVTVTCYARVVWALSVVPQGVVGRSRRKARAVVMAVTVLVVFVVCFTPTNSLLLAHYLQFARGVEMRGSDDTYAAYLVSMCVGSISCCLDPLVYYFGSSQCQRQMAGVLRCQASREGKKSLHSSGSSRDSSRTNTRITKMDAFQASLSSQYKKLLV